MYNNHDDNFTHVYQLKITLQESDPPIWRVIQVPENYSFFRLHLAIIHVMGWMNHHLHEFNIGDVTIGKEEKQLMHEVPTVCEKEARISDYLKGSQREATYLYDFGDQWDHDVVLEEVVPRIPGARYPMCLAGEMAAPPDDCGGMRG